MSAAEFVRFWNGVRMKAMATASADGAPHIAPVHAEFVNGRLRSTIYENAVRRIDLQGNPRVALTTWGADGSVAIIYGRAREVPDSGRETRPGATGKPRRTVALDIEVTRIYAMKARSERVSGHGQYCHTRSPGARMAVMKLVEVVQGPHVSDETAQISLALCERSR